MYHVADLRLMIWEQRTTLALARLRRGCVGGSLGGGGGGSLGGWG